MEALLGKVLFSTSIYDHYYQTYASVSSSVNDVHRVVDKFSRCVYDVETWMGASRLRLNASKIQVLWFGSADSPSTTYKY